MFDTSRPREETPREYNLTYLAHYMPGLAYIHEDCTLRSWVGSLVDGEMPEAPVYKPVIGLVACTFALVRHARIWPFVQYRHPP